MKNYRALSDRELIARCLDGEERAWEELIERYKRVIYSIPFKYGLSAEDAADVFQTTCTILLENIHSLRDESKLSSWLITTTSRECWKLKRKRKYERTPTDERPAGGQEPESMDPLPLPEKVISDLEEQHLIRRGLQLLDERCRRLLYYIFYERKTASYKEIGKALHMPVSSIGPTRARCLAKLKKILAKLGWH